MDNSRKKSKNAEVHSDFGAKRRKLRLPETSDTPRNQGATLHEKSGRSKSKASKRNTKEVSPKGSPTKPSKLAALEEELVAAIKVVGTPFKHVTAQSNPHTAEITAYPAAQWWFETYRTTKKEAIAGVVRLTQEVVVGSVIISNKTTEAAAREECYWLLEHHIEPYIVGLMPQTLGASTEIITPISDSETAFTQMEGSGMFTLTTLWDFQWIVSKGAKP